ncbi:MAG: hypothetical protein E6K53_07240 [Gammaproteobacteria bacterium]|nr:MAG: hypothetical protein E6K53_07240 [Gammaproteobacteria bacterium]
MAAFLGGGDLIGNDFLTGLAGLAARAGLTGAFLLLLAGLALSDLAAFTGAFFAAGFFGAGFLAAPDFAAPAFFLAGAGLCFFVAILSLHLSLAGTVAQRSRVIA